MHIVSMREPIRAEALSGEAVIRGAGNKVLRHYQLSTNKVRARLLGDQRGGKRFYKNSEGYRPFLDAQRPAFR
jgi:hypothetical protein